MTLSRITTKTASTSYFAIVLLLAAVVLSAAPVPTRLTDQEFWRLASEMSEPDGEFHSENLVSNEIRFQTVVPALQQRAVSGRAYIGVGSEQNFTYIAAVRPSMAFIVDIRRGNLDLHLIYKALFELSDDRVQFVSRLFSRPAPPGLSAASSADEIFTAFMKAAPSQALYEQNLKEIKARLVTTHGLKLSAGDLDGMDYVYSSWFKGGPQIIYQLSGAGGAGLGRGRGGIGGMPTYAELMTSTDGTGRNQSYLADDAAFRFIKDLQSRNLIVPIVGNFGGKKALRAVGTYLKQQGAVVSTFYVSNVEQYLRQDNIWEYFCGNAATLPIDERSLFIRSARSGFQGAPAAGTAFSLQLDPIKPEVANCPPPH